MKKNRRVYQGDLFDSSRIRELREFVQEVDMKIKGLLNQKEYQQAKELIRQQEEAIQELVTLGDREIAKD